MRKSIYKDNYENCYNAALKCSSRYEFSKKYDRAYKEALKVRENGKKWIDDYYWFKPVKEDWTYETCYEEAKKYKTRSEFARGKLLAYKAALKNGWINDYYWFERDLDIYENKKDNVYAYFFTEFNSVYVGRSIAPNNRDKEHRNANRKKKSSVYKFAEKHNIPIPQMAILKTNITPDEGLVWEDYFVKEYKKDGWNILNKAKTGKGSGSLGGAAKKRNKKEVIEKSKKYKSLADFRKYDHSSYLAAYRNGWLNELDWLSKTYKSKPLVEISNGKAIQLFSSGIEAANKTGLSNTSISDCLKGKQKQTRGKQFMSLDNYLGGLMEQLRIECENIKQERAA